MADIFLNGHAVALISINVKSKEQVLPAPKAEFIDFWAEVSVGAEFMPEPTVFHFHEGSLGRFIERLQKVQQELKAAYEKKRQDTEDRIAEKELKEGKMTHQQAIPVLYKDIFTPKEIEDWATYAGQMLAGNIEAVDFTIVRPLQQRALAHKTEMLKRLKDLEGKVVSRDLNEMRNFFLHTSPSNLKEFLDSSSFICDSCGSVQKGRNLTREQGSQGIMLICKDRDACHHRSPGTGSAY